MLVWFTVYPVLCSDTPPPVPRMGSLPRIPSFTSNVAKRQELRERRKGNQQKDDFEAAADLFKVISLEEYLTKGENTLKSVDLSEHFVQDEQAGEVVQLIERQKSMTHINLSSLWLLVPLFSFAMMILISSLPLFVREKLWWCFFFPSFQPFWVGGDGVQTIAFQMWESVASCVL